MKKTRPQVRITPDGLIIYPDTVELIDERDRPPASSLLRELTPNTPRRATFDDLRVGQWVAWVPESGASCGKIVSERGPQAFGATSGGGDVWPITKPMCERGEVTILRDAPAPPVQVRREDYDALVAALGREDRRTLTVGAWDQVIRAARALIDNAVRDDS